MCAEYVANAMQFAWTCRISYGKPLDCVPFICRLEKLIATLRNMSEWSAMERRLNHSSRRDDGGKRDATEVLTIMRTNRCRPQKLDSGPTQPTHLRCHYNVRRRGSSGAETDSRFKQRQPLAHRMNDALSPENIPIAIVACALRITQIGTLNSWRTFAVTSTR
jgi:hypothetical protein